MKRNSVCTSDISAPMLSDMIGSACGLVLMQILLASFYRLAIFQGGVCLPHQTSPPQCFQTWSDPISQCLGEGHADDHRQLMVATTYHQTSNINSFNILLNKQKEKYTAAQTKKHWCLCIEPSLPLLFVENQSADHRYQNVLIRVYSIEDSVF